MKAQNAELRDRVGDLAHELEVEKQQVELKAKVRELEKIKKELLDKDKKNE